MLPFSVSPCPCHYIAFMALLMLCLTTCVPSQQMAISESLGSHFINLPPYSQPFDHCRRSVNVWGMNIAHSETTRWWINFLQFQPSCCFLVYGLDYNVCEQDRLKPKRQISLKYQQVCWTLYHSDVKCFTPMWIQKWCKLELSSRADGIREASQRYSWEVNNAHYEGWITLIQTIVSR